MSDDNREVNANRVVTWVQALLPTIALVVYAMAAEHRITVIEQGLLQNKDAISELKTIVSEQQKAISELTANQRLTLHILDKLVGPSVISVSPAPLGNHKDARK